MGHRRTLLSFMGAGLRHNCFRTDSILITESGCCCTVSSPALVRARRGGNVGRREGGWGAWRGVVESLGMEGAERKGEAKQSRLPR